MKKIDFKANDIIFYQGEESDSLYILIDGELEILIAEDNIDFSKKNEIIASSSRVGTISEPKKPFGEISFILNTPRNATIRGISDGTLIQIPAGKDTLKNLVNTNPAIGLAISKNLLKNCLKTYDIIKTTSELIKKSKMFYDNFSYIFYSINQKNSEFQNNDIFSRGEILYNSAHGNGDKISKKLSLAIVETDLSDAFSQDYTIPVKIPDINEELIDFIKNTLYLPDRIIKLMIRLNSNIIETITLKLSDYLQHLNSVFMEFNNMLNKQIVMLADADTGLIREFAFMEEKFKTAGHPNYNFVKKVFNKLLLLINELSNLYIELYGKQIKNFHPELLKLNAKIRKTEMAQEEKDKEQKIQKIIDSSELVIEDNFTRLMSLNVSSAEIKKQLRETMEEYNKTTDKFDTFGPIRKIKKDLTNAYWTFYKDLFVNYLDSDKEMDNYVLLMLRYGLFDDNLLDENAIRTIKATPMDTPHSMDIFFLDEWLEKIYNDDATPSINGLGQTFEEWVKENRIELKDPVNTILNYEIVEAISVAVRSCAGVIAQQSCILDSDYITANPESSIVTKQRLEKTIKEIMDIDFSIFYREIRIICDDKPEFVNKEVLPKFIILPCAGTRVMCWQELEGRSKDTQARFFIPLFATGDLKEMLIQAFGHFRWELAKTMAGPNWGDPIEGGLTGKYFDYTTSYKQSKEISAEIKEKIKLQMKKFPDTKDKVAEDYRLWLNYEADGIMKLNKLNREIFFHHVPFSKPVRDKLAANPNFEKLNFKFVNVNKKKIKQIETKIKKLENSDIPVPEEMKNELEYYRLMI